MRRISSSKSRSRRQFTCELDLGDGFVVGTVSGSVAFTLEQSASGEFLVIRDGTLTGQEDFYGVMFDSPLTGSLDCATNTFHAEVDGTYGSMGLVMGTIGGTLDAQLDRTTQTLTGTWGVFGSSFASTIPCEGPWNAIKQP